MVVKRGRPKSKNPSKQAMKKRLYRLKQYLDKENQWNTFMINVINGMKNFLKSPRIRNNIISCR